MTDDELKALAQEIVGGILDDFRKSLFNDVDDIVFSRNWYQEIERVQRDALQIEFPSEADFRDWVHLYVQEDLKKSVGGGLPNCWESYRWLRANIKLKPNELQNTIRMPDETHMENEAAYFYLTHPKMSPSQMFFEGARWLSKNVKFKTDEPVSDEELHRLSGKYHETDFLGGQIESYEAGFRACEKRLKGE